MNITLTDEIFKKLGSTADSLQLEAYVVGGYVRDLFLKRDSKDIDVVVVGDGIEFAKAFANRLNQKCDFAVFKNFGTAMVKTDEWEVEFVGIQKLWYCHG